MPPGAENAESYSDYLLGVRDGVPKTPQWAEHITAVPAATITRIAREYATRKPAVLYQGYGMQRRAYGEQVVRAGCTLAAITGNFGISGGWASGLGLQAPDGGPSWTVFPLGENPVKAAIPVFLWTEACLRGKEKVPATAGMTQADGLTGAPRLESDIKLIYAVATNCLVNQHANVNRSAEILRDESKVEFLVVQDNFLTPTGQFCRHPPARLYPVRDLGRGGRLEIRRRSHLATQSWSSRPASASPITASAPKLQSDWASGQPTPKAAMKKLG